MVGSTRRRPASHKDTPTAWIATSNRHVLDRDDIDAVAVGSTETWHAIHIVQSMKAGKDVYGEKPMSMTIREAAAIRLHWPCPGRARCLPSQDDHQNRPRRTESGLWTIVDHFPVCLPTRANGLQRCMTCEEIRKWSQIRLCASPGKFSGLSSLYFAH